MLVQSYHGTEGLVYSYIVKLPRNYHGTCPKEMVLPWYQAYSHKPCVKIYVIYSHFNQFKNLPPQPVIPS